MVIDCLGMNSDCEEVKGHWRSIPDIPSGKRDGAQIHNYTDLSP